MYTYNCCELFIMFTCINYCRLKRVHVLCPGQASLIFRANRSGMYHMLLYDTNLQQSDKTFIIGLFLYLCFMI